MVLTELIDAFGMDLGTAGRLGSLTVLASAAGGVFLDVLADRLGRTRALSLSILLY
jgi:predicted MFS family arabinose efflux permease